MATGPAHAALEARIGALDSRPAYNEYVLGLHAFRSAVETWLKAHDFTHVGAWQSQRIAPELQDDLNDLALMPLDRAPSPWSATASASFALGVHYVLEGSALGARVLCKQVATLGMHRNHGARHLWAQAETLDNWRGFLGALADYKGDESALFDGANAAFGAAVNAMGRAAYV